MNPLIAAMSPFSAISGVQMELSDALLYHLGPSQTHALREATRNTGAYWLNGHISSVISKCVDPAASIAWVARLGDRLRSLRIEKAFDEFDGGGEDDPSDDALVDDENSDHHDGATWPYIFRNNTFDRGFQKLESLALEHAPCNDHDLFALCEASAAGRLSSLKHLSILNSEVGISFTQSDVGHEAAARKMRRVPYRDVSSNV
eukprot:1004878-Pleurochrysis_carterae.AAC.1